MYINKSRFAEFVKNNFNGNYHKCAEALNVDVSTVSRIINGNSNAGAKFLGNLMAYCKLNGLDFNNYIFLDKPLLESNTKTSA